jgi:5-methylcytosine-specific restriction protein A
MPKRTEAAREADKEYNRRKRDKKSQGFYESDAWRNLRKQQINRQPLCEMCLKEGRYEKATAVDHITEIRKGGARLDIENLQSLCWSCHSRKTRSER